MKKLTAVLLLISALFVATGCTAAGADLLPAHTSDIAMAAPVAAVIPAPAIAAVPATMPQFSLPAGHDLGSIILWIFAVLIPCLGWLASEIMPFLPGKANGLLHGFVEMMKAPSYDPQSNSITLQLDEIKAALADFKGQAPAAPIDSKGA